MVGLLLGYSILRPKQYTHPKMPAKTEQKSGITLLSTFFGLFGPVWATKFKGPINIFLQKMLKQKKKLQPVKK